MKTFFQSLFKQKPKNNTTPNNYITFLVDEHNEPNLKISVINTDNTSAKIFADMLYEIASGTYENSILDLLIQIGEDDSVIKNFVHQVMIHYSLKKTNAVLGKDHSTNSKNDKPLIKPTEFNRR